MLSIYSRKRLQSINQILGYLISEIQRTLQVIIMRSDIRRLERDDLIEELLKEYAKAKQL
ncbi:MAG: IreB family regulatory phosphoprotein [Veillonella parvula]|uniref:IreB family regulatory phosphoprotein n=1 Tax=Veillonella parvula TaxID=29466 RepID=UPI0039A2CD05